MTTNQVNNNEAQVPEDADLEWLLGGIEALADEADEADEVLAEKQELELSDLLDD